MERSVFNFGAGPSALPEPVLRQAQNDLWDFRGTGIGIAEHSHRGRKFQERLDEIEAVCREIAGIPSEYRILFLQGGASLQFAMVPMNLLPADATADYLITDSWSKKAAKEARAWGSVHVAGTSEPAKFTHIPGDEEISYSSNPAYVHFTSNNTIAGTQWRREPEVPAGVPLIADASSDIFSRPLDIRKYGMVYAGAQKNLGIAGLVLAILREDLVEPRRELPTMLQYRTHAAENSLHNTPPTFAIHVLGLMLEWIREQGGLAAMAEHNARKAEVLYSYLDRSSLFSPVVQGESRSLMNLCFRTSSEELDAEFISQATKRGFSGLKGHRSVGGMRASIYNACPLEACTALAEFMAEFERSHA